MIINKRYLTLLLIINTFLFYSCHKKDPLVFLPENAVSAGHFELNSQSSKNFVITAESFMKKFEDSASILNSIIGESIGSDAVDIYFSTQGKMNYTAIIISKDLGKIIKKKMQIEKDISNFEYKETFSDRNFYLCPFDADIVICSNLVDEVTGAIKRTKEKSLLKNPNFDEIFKTFEPEDKIWLIAFDTMTISKMIKPFTNENPESPFIKNLELFKSLLIYKDKSSRTELTLQSKNLEREKIDNLETIFKKDFKNIDLKRIQSNFENYKFSEISFQNNNKTFQIIIK